jgi:hypothetical protein
VGTNQRVKKEKNGKGIDGNRNAKYSKSDKKMASYSLRASKSVYISMKRKS